MRACRGWCAKVVAIVIVANALTGCGSSGSGGKAAGRAAGQAVEAFLPKVSRGLHWVGGVAPGGKLSEVAQGLGTAIDTGTNINGQLKKIAASEDPFGEALVTATCHGLENIATQYGQNNNLLPASAQSWEKYLSEALAELLPANLGGQISARVNQFNNAAQLASINPVYAYRYVQQCALRHD
jgi:hypothetical protein